MHCDMQKNIKIGVHILIFQVFLLPKEKNGFGLTLPHPRRRARYAIGIYIIYVNIVQIWSIKILKKWAPLSLAVCATG